MNDSPDDPAQKPENPVAHPWMGLVAYGEGDARLFCGRQREVEALHRLVHRETLTVVFGPSGTGKSSLLNAGLFPRWRDEHFLPVPLRLDYSGGVAPDDQVRDAVAAAIAVADVEAVPLNEPIAEQEGPESAWEYLHRFEFWDRRNHPVVPILVFDQFEEVFTLGGKRPETEAFIEQLANLVENYIPAEVSEPLNRTRGKLPRNYSNQQYKIILSLREDFVSRLDSLNRSIPSVMLNRFSLERMNGSQALEVVLKPGGDIVDEPVARDIVQFVASSRTSDREEIEDPDEQFDKLVVEPALLSLVCRELNTRRLATGQSSITAEQLEASSDDILEDFYERSFEGTDGSGRIFVEDRLVTASGYRSTVPMEDALESGLADEEIAGMIDRRLIRKEDRLGIPHLELTHDVLTGVVQQSRDSRRERERLERERRERAERARRTRKLVLTLGSVALIFLCFGLVSLYLWRSAEAARKAAEAQARINLAQNLFLSAEKLSRAGDRDLPILLLASAHHGHVLDLGSNQVETAYRDALTSNLLGTLARRRSVASCTWSPGGDRIAFVSDEGTVEIWSWKASEGRGELIQRFDSAGATVAAWSTDGKRLAVGDLKGKVQVRELESGQSREAPMPGEFPVSSMAWDPSPGGARLAWGTLNGSIRIWNPDTGASREFGTENRDPVNAITWDGDGSRLISADDGGAIRLWDPATALQLEVVAAHPDEVRCLAWIDGPRDIRLLASGSRDGGISIWNLEGIGEGSANRNPTATIAGHPQAVQGLAWSPSGLVSAGEDGSIRVWAPMLPSLGEWEEALVLPAHAPDPPGGIKRVAWNPAFGILASCGSDGTVRIWDPARRIGPDLVHHFEGEDLSVVDWSPDGALLALGGSNGKVWVLPWNANTENWRIEDEPIPVRALAWSPSSNRLAIARSDGSIRIRDSKGGEIEATLDAHEGSVWQLQWSRDGNRLASSGNDGRIRVWDSQGWVPAIEQPFPPAESAPIRALLWDSRDRFAWADDDGRIRLSETGPPRFKELTSHEGEDSYCLAWSRSGQSNLIAIAEWEEIRIWDIGLGREGPEFHRGAHDREVTSLAWTSDGRRLASAGFDKTVRIWDPSAQPNLVHLLEGHEDDVWQVAWDPQGKRLASVGADGRLRIWQFDEESMLERAKRMVNRNLTIEEWTGYIGETYPFGELFDGLPAIPVQSSE